MTEAAQITATILGCGSSGGVPRVGNIWGDCNPKNEKNRRRRCALLVTGTTPGTAEATRVLIDTGCDMREQLLDANVEEVSAVLYTHEHADHTHGIDDLRVLALNNQKRVDVYFSKTTGERLRQAFGYCFSAPPGSPYPPILNAHELKDSDEITIEGPGGSIPISAFPQEHGGIISLGFRIKNFAYSCDVSAIPNESQKAVSNLDVWILDALRFKPHPSHFSVSDALACVERYEPKTTVLTNLHIDLDYDALNASTPEHVTTAFDGMEIDVTHGKIMSR